MTWAMLPEMMKLWWRRWWWQNHGCTARSERKQTRCRTKPDVSPLGCAASRLRPVTHMLHCSSVDKTNENWLLWQSPSKDRKLISDWWTTALVLPTLKIWRKSVRYIYFEIIGLTGIVNSREEIYRVGQKTGPQTHDHNSVKSLPIYKVFSLEDSLLNLQLNGY